MAKTARVLSSRGITIIKHMMEYTQPKLQTSLQYTKMNLVPLATTKIPAFANGTSKLLRDITVKAFANLVAHKMLSFIETRSEDSSDYKRLVELLEKVVAMVPVEEIKELCAGLDVSNTSFVIFLKSLDREKLENIISKIQDIPGVKEIHEFLQERGINVDVRFVAMGIIWLATGIFSP